MLVKLDNVNSARCRVCCVSLFLAYLQCAIVLLSVVFPQDLLEKGLEANNFAMLGLGDIVIPGILIALLLRFDVRSVPLALMSITT